MKNFKTDFPLFSKHPQLVYLDSASTSQKPQIVVDSPAHTYTYANANVHRSIYTMGQVSTDEYEAVRNKVKNFIHAKQRDEIIFTSGTTESINLVAEGWGRQNLKRGDIVVVSPMEHHSNLIPWQRLKDDLGIQIYYLSLTSDYRLNYRDKDLDISKVKLLALSHASNVLGTINPIGEIVQFFKQHGPSDLRFLIDSAQSASHLPIDVAKLDIDFLVFSGHKTFGPSGTGVLYINQELQDTMEPLRVGSHMVEYVDRQTARWAKSPDKFEAGTPNIEGVIGLGNAIDYINGVGWQSLQRHEERLIDYALESLGHVKGITIYGPQNNKDRLAIFSFNLSGLHPHDVAEILNRSHVCVRAGHHCAQPLMQYLAITGTVRASMHLYNTTEDIDRLIQGLEETRRILG